MPSTHQIPYFFSSLFPFSFPSKNFEKGDINKKSVSDKKRHKLNNKMKSVHLAGGVGAFECECAISLEKNQQINAMV